LGFSIFEASTTLASAAAFNSSAEVDAVFFSTEVGGGLGPPEFSSTCGAAYGSPATEPTLPVLFEFFDWLLLQPMPVTPAADKQQTAATASGL
jgi:hypothetical protein